MPARTNATIIVGGGSSQNPILREYITSSVWTKPNGLKYIQIIAVGGGGGGASGQRQLSNNIAYGGDFGKGGYILNEILPAATFGSTVSIIVGAGGRGGTASNNTTAVNGTAGGNSSFGTYIAKGGLGGVGNTTIATAVKDAITAPNGGFGGKSSTTTNTSGEIGGGIYLTSSVLSVGGPGGTASSSNGIAGTPGFDNVKKFYGSNYGIGTGGGGGAAQRAAGTVGVGANGGLYGAGGGGGGGVNSTTVPISGTGGNGANGVVFVIEIY